MKKPCHPKIFRIKLTAPLEMLQGASGTPEKMPNFQKVRTAKKLN